jgi:glutamate/tyrosine decarboxylase-like PLP-dependent enzyme
MNPLLRDAASRAARYVETVARRRVAPQAQDVQALDALGGPMPVEPSDPAEVLSLLDTAGSPATVAGTGPRYFGFVTGGVLPAAMAASWLASAWDQNGALRVMSPVAARLEDIALEWLRDLLRLPSSCGAGFVTGATMANFSCLAAARHALLERAGHDVEAQGLFGAPPLTVVVGEEVHVALLKALSMLGLGSARVTRVPTDDQGRIIASRLPRLDQRTIVCLQAGNVNTGSFDPAGEICSRAAEHGAWVHVDGAFGLWAAAAPAYAYLLEGFAAADSWATDCHKWLNVSYDSGLAFVRNPEYLRRSMTFSAAYLHTGESREPAHYVPESSRRARGIEVWAALRSLGKQGVAGLIARNCALAQRFARGLEAAGLTVLNDVVLNQVMVELPEDVIRAIQEEGTCWCGSTRWHGRTAMRISVSSWATTEEDVDLSLEAILRMASSD